MQFFYMQKDFYAGQFTKTLYPKFNGLNATIAKVPSLGEKIKRFFKAF